jgi:hypothetical protein
LKERADAVSSSSGADRYRVPVSALVPFLVVAFGLAWTIIGLYIFAPAQLAGLFGALTGQHPLFYLAVYSPAIAALALVARHTGFAGLKRYLSRLLLWRCSPAWWIFLILGIPMLFVVGALLKGGLFAAMPSFTSFRSVLAALAFAAIKGPVEEFGWRGLALPLLQRKMAPVWASLVLGVIWGLWHLPAFLVGGTQQSAWAFTPFFIGAVALSVIVTAMFNSSGGSILLPVIFHFQLINPLWPDAQPFDTYPVVAASILVFVLNRRSMLGRRHAVTEVVPKENILRERRDRGRRGVRPTT